MNQSTSDPDSAQQRTLRITATDYSATVNAAFSACRPDRSKKRKMLKPQPLTPIYRAQQFPSGKGAPGTGFSTHKRRQDKCGTGNSKRSPVAASQERPVRSAPAETAAPARAERHAQASPRVNPKPTTVFPHHKYQSNPFPCCRVGRYSSCRSFPAMAAGIPVAVCATAIRDDQSVSRNDIRASSPPDCRSQLLPLRILPSSRVRCQRWDVPFATDHANDVQPAYLTVLTKTPASSRARNIDGIVISSAENVSQRAILLHAIGSGKIVIIGF